MLHGLIMRSLRARTAAHSTKCTVKEIYAFSETAL